MQNKKTIIVVAVAVAVVIIIMVIAYIFSVQMRTIRNLDQIAQKNAANITQCPYNSDQEAYGKAIETVSENACACIEDVSMEIACLDFVSDSDLYQKAIDENKQEVCSDIKDEVGEESCRLAVQDGTDYIDGIKQVAEEVAQDLTIVDFEKIRQDDPNNVDNLINLAMAYVIENFSGEEGQVDADKIDASLSIIEEAKRIEPENARIHTAEGYVFSANKEYNKAIDVYNKSLELEVDDLENLLSRGKVYSILGKNVEAIADFEKALELDKDRLYAGIITDPELCQAYATNGDYEKATWKCNLIINENDDELLKVEARKVLESLK